MGAARELPPQVHSFEDNARQHGRVRCHAIQSSLGEILDLSATGARIRRRKRLPQADGSTVNIEIQGLDGAVRVLGRVIWSRRLGFFKHEIGVVFEDISPEVRKALTTIARCAPANAVLGRLTLERARRSA
ncbi:MAG: PilZ domain-containing protein [Phycisphaerales bacterium]